MDLLFKRSQTTGWLRRVKFKVWGKAEFGDEEKELIRRYQLDKAILIAATQPELMKNTVWRAIAVLLVLFLCLNLFGLLMGGAKPRGIDSVGLYIAAVLAANFIEAAIVALIYGFWYYHQKRETIYVRDLIHGRYFKCDSIVELARKEAWLETICAFLRQVMESAKHWDGETRCPIEALPKDEAKQIIIKGI